MVTLISIALYLLRLIQSTVIVIPITRMMTVRTAIMMTMIMWSSIRGPCVGTVSVVKWSSFRDPCVGPSLLPGATETIAVVPSIVIQVGVIDMVGVVGEGTPVISRRTKRAA